MAENRDFKGVWIPKEIWLLNDISAIEKLLLVEIHSLDNKDGCFAGNEYFSEFFGISIYAISRHIKKLKANGYIKQTFFDGRKRILKSCIDVKIKAEVNKTSKQTCKKVKADLQKSQGSLDEKCKCINTINNTTNNIVNKDTTTNNDILNSKELSNYYHTLLKDNNIEYIPKKEEYINFAKYVKKYNNRLSPEQVKKFMRKWFEKNLGEWCGYKLGCFWSDIGKIQSTYCKICGKDKVQTAAGIVCPVHPKGK